MVLEALPVKIILSFTLYSATFGCLNLARFLPLALISSSKKTYFRLNYLLGWGDKEGKEEILNGIVNFF